MHKESKQKFVEPKQEGHRASGAPPALTRKPQAMLVDEKSMSVETVKKEPPFATIEAGNANRTKAKGGSSIWTKKVYHIRVGIANIT